MIIIITNQPYQSKTTPSGAGLATERGEKSTQNYR